MDTKTDKNQLDWVRESVNKKQRNGWQNLPKSKKGNP